MSTPAKPKVICLGLGRTGTSSLYVALEKLGFGPHYHMATIIKSQDAEEYARWRKFSNGEGTIEDMHQMLDNYGCVLDYPPAMFPEQLYAAYPDAKFILTTRDPEKWAKSINSTVLYGIETTKNMPKKPPFLEALTSFIQEVMLDWFHKGRLGTPEGPNEILKHNERVKNLIPSDKLLIYEVEDGWDPLAKFLGVPKPEEPFPHINDSEQFRARFDKMAAGGSLPSS